MRKFSKIVENKDLSYSFLGKNVSHIDSLTSNIRNSIIEIIREEKGVSEKSFKQYDEIINFVKEKFNEEMKNESIELYNNGKRIDYIAEMLYDKYFNN